MTAPVSDAPRLLLVEGSIGTGKSTTARLLAEALVDAGVPARAVLEGDPEHPADFESVALVEPERLDALLDGCPGWADRVRAVTRPHPEGLLVAHGVLERDHGPVPGPLGARLRDRDVYELPLEQHLRLRLERWGRFVSTARAGSDVWVLECCVLQNLLTVTLLRDDAPEEVLLRAVRDMAGAAASLSPVVVHLRADDVGDAFRAAAAERPAWWLDHVVGYYTGRGLGARLGGTGVEGTVAVLRERARVEERVLEASGVAVLPVAAVRDQDVLLPPPLARLVARTARGPRPPAPTVRGGPVPGTGESSGEPPPA